MLAALACLAPVTAQLGGGLSQMQAQPNQFVNTGDWLWEAGDVAVFVGVALHGPQHPRNELILPIQFYSAVDGVVTDLLPTLRPEGGAGDDSGSRQSV